LVYEIPMFTIVNSKEVAFMKRLEAFELIEAYKEGRLKGRLAEIAAGLDEEDNAVIMLAKYRK
ncbi:MAG: 6-bladed beta-propeller, partial [Tannerellaceae bacterium]|nr:6-bladed beta-propeller [Tannerellaceae bacterium]